MNRGSGLCSSILDAMSWTPLVDLKRLVERRRLEGRVLAKCDFLLPGAAKKDRIALEMVEDAEASGELKPGQAVVELTSGNTGIGLAIVCAVKNHPFVAVMSKGNSVERARMMKALGAELAMIDQAPGSRPGQVSGEDLRLVEEAAQRIVRERGAFRADQFSLDGALSVHYKHTGPEFWEQSGGTINAFCDFAGTGGTFTGTAQYLKEKSPSIRCYVIEPEGAAALAGSDVVRPGHRIQGGGYSRKRENLKHFDPAICDGYMTVSDDVSIATARELATVEGIFAGFSSGANVASALALLEGPCRGQTVACVICDSGLKYLSTDLWE